MFYPDRQAFFARLSRSLSLKPAIKIGPAPLPNRRAQAWTTQYAESGVNGDAEQRATKDDGEPSIREKTEELR